MIMKYKHYHCIPRCSTNLAMNGTPHAILTDCLISASILHALCERERHDEWDVRICQSAKGERRKRRKKNAKKEEELMIPNFEWSYEHASLLSTCCSIHLICKFNTPNHHNSSISSRLIPPSLHLVKRIEVDRAPLQRRQLLQISALQLPKLRQGIHVAELNAESCLKRNEGERWSLVTINLVLQGEVVMFWRTNQGCYISPYFVPVKSLFFSSPFL